MMNKNFLEINEKLRKEIIRLRLEKKMTKKEFSEKTGFSYSKIRNIENNGIVSILDLFYIAEVFDTYPSQIFKNID